MGKVKESELISFLNEKIEDLSLEIEKDEEYGYYNLARDKYIERIAYKTVLVFIEKGGRG